MWKRGWGKIKRMRSNKVKKIFTKLTDLHADSDPILRDIPPVDMG
jgi:hypothetical protein